MFTGLVTEVGKVKRLTRDAPARLTIDAGSIAEGLRTGDSVAVNGACLTVTAVSGREVSFDVVAETLDRTNLGELRPGDPVNLERPLKAGDEFGGHLVLGHVDGVGRITRIAPGPSGADLEISADDHIMRYIVEKGSVAVDGVSLTVAHAGVSTFTVALIPHTLGATNLYARRVGDRVNIEADIIGKYVEKFVFGHRMSRSTRKLPSDLTEDWLRRAGF